MRRRGSLRGKTRGQEPRAKVWGVTVLEKRPAKPGRLKYYGLTYIPARVANLRLQPMAVGAILDPPRLKRQRCRQRTRKLNADHSTLLEASRTSDLESQAGTIPSSPVETEAVVA